MPGCCLPDGSLNLKRCTRFSINIFFNALIAHPFLHFNNECMMPQVVLYDYSFLRCGEKRKVSEEDFESILACMPFKKFKNEKVTFFFELRVVRLMKRFKKLS